MTKSNDLSNVSTYPDVSSGNIEDENESLFDPLDEEISAYLDDELTEEERQNFERRLESDPVLKEKFETHRSAWNALEALVDVSPNVDVTEAAVERLNSETKSELTELNKRKRRRKYFFLFVCISASCIFVVLGYCLFGLVFPDVQKQRANDRNVVSRLVQLEAIGNFEYLVALSQADLFAKRPVPDGSSRLSRNTSNQRNIQEYQEIERSYEEVSQDRSFYRLQQRFERLDVSTQKQLRLLWNQIETAPNREILLKTLDDYMEWLTYIANDEERERLQMESIPERIADVRRKNEELARFWDRSPAWSQTNETTVKSQPTGARSNKPQNRNDAEPFASDVSAPFATQMLMLRNLLPEELRREDFRSVYQKYDFFRNANGSGAKDDDDILDFLKSESNVYDSLSEDAKKYLASLSEDERRSVLSLITALCVSEKNAGDYYRQNAFRRRSEPHAFPPVPFDNFMRRQNVPIRELAEDLRNAPTGVRDYVTSRPSQEAQALLFGLHWGGERMKSGFPPRKPDSESLESGAPFEISRP